MSSRPYRRSLPAFLAFAALLAVVGCRTAPDADGSTESASGLTPVQFEDIPIIDGMTLETQMNRSHSYEAGSFRIGDLYYYGNVDRERVVSYMTERMGLHGWKLVGETREDRETELRFERRPYRTRCTIWTDSSDLTRMHVEYRTDSAGEQP